MELKDSKYKMTDIGLIPSDWDVELLNELTTKIGSGITPTGGSSVYKEDGRPLVRSQNIGWGKLLLDDIVYINDETHQTFPNTEVKLNDVFLNISGASIGRTSFANEKLVGGNVNQHVCIIRTIQTILNPNFLNLFLLSKNGQKQIDSFQSGGNRQGLNISQIKTFQIPLPPTLTEQTAIATALSDADALITQLERLIAKKRAIKQGAMQELLRPKEGWEVKPIGIVADLYQPVTISQEHFTEDGFLVYGANGIIGRYSKFNHENWQTTITCRGSTCGTVNKTVDKCWITGNAMVANVDRNSSVDKLFFYFLLTRQDFTNCITGSGQPQIVRKPLSEFKISLPENKTTQHHIAKILSDVDNEIQELEKKLEKYKMLKQGMMQNLLTGKIRLI